MLTKSQKEQLVGELSERIKESKTVVVCDYKGVTVAEISKLRRALREKNAMMQVMKKTLATIAFKNNDIDFNVKSLEGQAALVCGGDDEVVGAKTIADFAKTNPNVKILGGVLEGKPLSAEQVKALAKLPSREQMLGTLVATINAPVSGFVQVLAGNIRNLANVLNAVKDAKEGK